MPKSLSKKYKTNRRRKAACDENLLKANSAKTHQKKRNLLSDGTNDTTLAKKIKELEGEVEYQKQKTKEEAKKQYNEACKNKAKEEARNLREERSRAQKRQQEDKQVTEEEMCALRDQISRLEESPKDLSQQRVILWKRCKRLKAAKEALKKLLQKSHKSGASSFGMKKKGRYTREASTIMRLIVSSGTAEVKVGKTLKEVSKILGVNIDHEKYSSDSTSHKHIKYELRTIALQVVDYSDPDATSEWTLHIMGIGTSVNHTSEVQVDGLRKWLEELADIFNNSPFAKRGNLCFVPDDFAYQLIGTSGDHAADQKKSHEILRIWRLEVILQRLGEEAIQWWGAERVLGVLILLKAKQIQEYGRQETWDSLSDDEKAGADILIVCEIGKQIFELLSPKEQEKLMCFIRTGCCMHKDLNCIKEGVKLMEGMWNRLEKTPPVLLASKDNAAVLKTRADSSAPTAAER